MIGNLTDDGETTTSCYGVERCVRWKSISIRRFSVEIYIYGLTRVWEWLRWMRIEVLSGRRDKGMCSNLFSRRHPMKMNMLPPTHRGCMQKKKKKKKKQKEKRRRRKIRRRRRGQIRRRLAMLCQHRKTCSCLVAGATHPMFHPMSTLRFWSCPKSQQRRKKLNASR